MEVRFALRNELEQVNRLREMVNEVHVNGRPDIFRPGFCKELQDRVYDLFDRDNADIIVAVKDGTICGFATVEYISRPESPYNLARSYCHIEEFGVDTEYRRMGVASAIIAYCRDEAAKRGLPRIELDMWSFNEGALAFYEAAGFHTFRRYMEMDV